MAEVGVDAGSSRIVRTVTSPDEELRTLPTPTEDLASKGARETCKTNGYFEGKF